MSDDTNQVVENKPIESTTAEQSTDKSPESAAPVQETLREVNMRTLRERAEAAERKAKDLEMRLHSQAEVPSRQSSSAPQRRDDPEDINIGDEDLIEGKHLKKYISSITKKYDQELQQIKSQNTIDNAERTLRAKYNDFDSVISEDNVNNFKSLYPEEFTSIMSNPDPYARLKTAYTNIVHFGIADRRQTTRDVDRRLEDNKTRPRTAASSPSTSAESPLSKVPDFERRVLTEDMKERIRQDLANAKKALKYRRE